MIKKEILEWLKAIAIAIVFYIIINVFVFSAKVDGDSMSPTLSNNDFLITLRQNNKSTYNYEDIVVFNVKSKEFPLIKRIVGLPGDHIEIKNGYIYRNGTELKEEYINVETSGDFNAIIEEEHLFVLGDNRGNSADSRISEIGQVEMENVKGKVILRIYPQTKKF